MQLCRGDGLLSAFNWLNWLDTTLFIIVLYCPSLADICLPDTLAYEQMIAEMNVSGIVNASVCQGSCKDQMFSLLPNTTYGAIVANGGSETCEANFGLTTYAENATGGLCIQNFFSVFLYLPQILQLQYWSLDWAVAPMPIQVQVTCPEFVQRKQCCRTTHS